MNYFETQISLFWNKLSKQQQTLLLALFPFQYTFFFEELEFYIQCLNNNEIYKNNSVNDFKQAINELIKAGFIRKEINDGIDGDFFMFYIHPLFSIFLNKLDFDKILQVTIIESYLDFYEQLGLSIEEGFYSTDLNEMEGSIFLAESEYYNLINALNVSLLKHKMLSPIYDALRTYLNKTHDYDKLITLSLKVLNKIEGIENKEKILNYNYFLNSVLIGLGNSYSAIYNMDKAKLYYNKAVKNTEGWNKPQPIANAYNNLANILQESCEYIKAENLYFKAYKIFKKNNHNQYVINTLTNIANNLCFQNKYQEAEKYFNKARKLARKIEDFYRLGLIHINMGGLYYDQKKYKKAQKYYKYAEFIFSDLDDFYLEKVYNGMALIKIKEEKYIEAEELLKKAISVAITTNNEEGKADSLQSLGLVYDEQKKYTLAKEYYSDAINIFISLNKIISQANTYNNLGLIAYENNNIEKGNQLFFKAVKLYQKLNEEKEIKEIIGEVEKKDKNFANKLAILLK